MYHLSEKPNSSNKNVTEESVKIIILEDDRLDADLIEYELKKTFLHFESIRSASLDEFVNLLDSSVDLVICDFQLSEFNAYNALTTLKATGYNIPLIIVSGAITETIGVNCMKLGATDYLLKDRLTRLGQSALLALEKKRLQDLTERSKKHLKLLSRINEVFNSSLELKTLAQNLCNFIVKNSSDYCALLSYDKNHQQISFSHAAKGTLPHLYEYNNVDSWVGLLKENAASYYSRLPEIDFNLVDHSHLLQLRKCGVENLFVVPLKLQSKVYALLAIGNNNMPFDDTDQSFYKDVAYRASIVLSNALLYEDTKKSRDEIQFLYKKVQESVQLKNEFLTTISHELRTPASSIFGYSELIKNKIFDSDATRKAVLTINKEAKNQLQVVNNVLDFSEIINGKLSSQFEKVFLSEIVQSVVDNFKIAIESKNLDVNVSIPTNEKPILGDSLRVQQIIWNLLSNAIKFTNPYGLISVELRENDNWMELSVQDDGVGISEEFLPFIFNRFRQANSSTSRKHEGLGLGLSISQYLVEMHGGKIEVKSNSFGSKKGSLFNVKLPVLAVDVSQVIRLRKTSDADEVFPHLNASALEPLELSPSNQNRKKILEGCCVAIVDDSDDSLLLIRSFLEGFGAKVHSFNNAPEALSNLASILPDFIFCDLGMPIMDGYSFVSRLRNHEALELRSTPTVALSAFSQKIFEKKTLEAGFDEYIEKPLTHRKFNNLIKKEMFQQIVSRYSPEH